MKAKIEKKEEKETTEELENLQKENQELQMRAIALQDLHNLKDESYYRQQTLMMMEKQRIEMENQTTALNKLGEKIESFLDSYEEEEENESEDNPKSE